ncbi:MAG: nucleotide triphosphate diphosphatase NUDT15 [Patescibacteria group bacterium]
MISTDKNRPRVGLGVIIVNAEGNILVGKRIGSHAPYYSIPGGHLDMGETFEQAAIREVREETGMDISQPRVIAITNNLETYRESGLHYISVVLQAGSHRGEPVIREPEKCSEWRWVDPRQLPQPHFDASRMGVACFLKKAFYLPEDPVR